MNVILIPFFLAANVVVKDTSEWTYGPEYLYNMNLTVVIKSDNLNPAEPIGNMELISAMKCRPIVAENSLLCIVQNFKTNVGLKTLEEENTTHEIKTEKMFKIKFNERGVESLLIEPPSRIQIVDLIRKFASQLSVGVDMRKIGMSHFTGDENISMVNCATMYRITREELPETLETHMTDNADFQLVVLPMADARPGTTLTIEKSRMNCNNSPRYHRESPVGILKMVHCVLRFCKSDQISFSVIIDNRKMSREISHCHTHCKNNIESVKKYVTLSANPYRGVILGIIDNWLFSVLKILDNE